MLRYCYNINRILRYSNVSLSLNSVFKHLVNIFVNLYFSDLNFFHIYLFVCGITQIYFFLISANYLRN